MAAVKDTTHNAQDQYFHMTNDMPEEIWYWAAIASIVTSAILFVSNRRDWSIFVGQWPPTFLLFGMFHKIIRPSTHS